MVSVNGRMVEPKGDSVYRLVVPARTGVEGGEAPGEAERIKELLQEMTGVVQGTAGGESRYLYSYPQPSDTWDPESRVPR